MTDNIKAKLLKYSPWSLIGLGFILRLRQYLTFRSLWLDEAMLANNIVSRDWLGLFQPLNANQGAPLGFLLIEKLAILVLGNDELSLRLFPLLAGCASLVLLYLLVRKILNPVGTLLALAIFAVLPSLIYYSSEVKQYSTDVFFSMLLLWVAFDYFDFDSDELRPKLVLAACGVVALFFSHPAVFILAAIGIMLFLDRIIVHDRDGLLSISLIGVTWLLFLGILYLITLRQLSNNTFLTDYWKAYFSLNPLDALLALFRYPGGFQIFVPGLLIVSGLGIVLLFKRNWKLAGTFLLALFFTFIASWLGKYPFGARLMLFSLPILAVTLAASVDWVSNLQLRPRIIFITLSILLSGWMISAPLLSTVSLFLNPQYRENIRPSMFYLRSKYKTKDVLIVYPGAIAAFKYYAPFYGFETTKIITAQEDKINDFQNMLPKFKSHTRVWVIFSHTSTRGLNNWNNFLSYLGKLGERKDQFIAPGASSFVYLYEMK